MRLKPRWQRARKNAVSGQDFLPDDFDALSFGGCEFLNASQAFRRYSLQSHRESKRLIIFL
jgi:hypothetical protein